MLVRRLVCLTLALSPLVLGGCQVYISSPGMAPPAPAAAGRAMGNATPLADAQQPGDCGACQQGGRVISAQPGTSEPAPAEAQVATAAPRVRFHPAPTRPVFAPRVNLIPLPARGAAPPSGETTAPPSRPAEAELLPTPES